MDGLSDESLMLKYRNGDADAFEILYKRHKDALYRFVRRQCRDPETAYDLVHDIWLKLIKARRRYRLDARFTTYLYTLARNRMIDHYRVHAARTSTIGSMADPVDVEDIPDENDGGPEMGAHVRNLVEQLLATVQALPQVQRETVLMYVEGLSMAEIGLVTEVPAETARSRLRRALAKLRQELEQSLS